MDLFEKGAIEAMLNLSRPTPEQSISMQQSFSLQSSPQQSLSILPTPRTPESHPPLATIPQISHSTQPNLSAFTTSTVSPSLSPSHPQTNNPPRNSTSHQSSRPLAMCLSQLLAPTPPDLPPFSAPSTIPPPSHSAPTTSACFPLPPLNLALQATSACITYTEPLTPPYTPPVLPPFSSVTAIPVMNAPSRWNTSPSVNAMACSNDAYYRQTESRQVALGGIMDQGIDHVHSHTTAVFHPAGNASAQKGGGLGLLGTDTCATTRHVAVTAMTQHAITSRTNKLQIAARSNDDTRSTNSSGTIAISKRSLKRPYKKYYSNPTPSSHCHVCARTSKAVKFAVCAKISEGLCRKVTCHKCFMKFGWDWDLATGGKEWICVHCRGVCPEGRSQCFIYSRVNSKRESKRGKRKTKKFVESPKMAGGGLVMGGSRHPSQG